MKDCKESIEGAEWLLTEENNEDYIRRSRLHVELGLDANG